MERDESVTTDELVIDPVNEACASEGERTPSKGSLGQMEVSNGDVVMHSLDQCKKNDTSASSAIQRSQSLPYLHTPVDKLSTSGMSPQALSSLVPAEGTIRPDSVQGSLVANASQISSQSPADARSSNLSADSASLDMNVATSRMRTFRKFWSRKNEFENFRLLVMCGFYCLGQGDAVECFHCHIVIANWTRNDDPRARHLENSPHCDFAKGENCGDVPLPTQIRRDMATNLRTNSPIPSLRNSQESILQPRPDRSRSHVQTTLPESERLNLFYTFPCSNPANPTMRQEQARLSTLNNSNFRLNTRLRASNETVAKAGLYYDGESDKTKCWFCDGGLKDYQEDDDPWVEHAKYYPSCEYLAQQRGPAWVNEISVRNPHVQRPILPTREGEVLPESQVSSNIFVTYPMESPRTENIPTPRETRQAILNEAMQSAPTRNVIGMGFEEQVVKNAQIRRIMETGSYYETSEMLLDAILGNNRQQNTSEQNGRNVIDLSGRTIRIRGGNFSGRNVINGVLYNTPVSHGAEELMGEMYHSPNGGHVLNNINRNVRTTRDWTSSTPLSSLPENGSELRNERGCKICYTNMADILFLPCRHICACAPCSRRLNECPVCRVRITNTIQVYRS